MKKVLLLLLLFLFFSFHSSVIFAESIYVLPYPSFMPGNKLYKIQQVFEFIQEYWYFGNFAQFSYNLKIADKYLVESKILFEYKQYLLAYISLEKSNMHFNMAPLYLSKAYEEGKNISEKKEILYSAAEKHREILFELKKDTPNTFRWSPEKDKPTELEIHSLIDKSISLRKKYL